MKRAPLTLAGIVAGVTLTTVGHAEAFPLCGGNKHQWQAPVTCTNTRTIDGTTFTVVIDEKASGFLTVDFTLDAPRAVDTPISARSSTGKSSSPISTDPTAVIPAGATSGHLELARALCGQLDVKAVFTGGGQPQGRIAGPWINNSTCLDIAVVTPPTSSPSLAPPASPPVTVSGGPSTPAPPSVSGPPTSTKVSELPATGGDETPLLMIGVLLILLGFAVMLVRRREPKVVRHNDGWTQR